jgi:nitrogen fixation/metabolism regulation signal transduction histidine kinase
VIDIVSSKIFTQGIKLDIQTEEVEIYGDKEALEQALYNLLSNAIENYNFDDPNKYLSVSVRKLGSTVLMDLFDSGREFTKGFLRQAKGLATGMAEHTELAIAQSLIEEFTGKISFENVANEDGHHVGRKAQIILEAVSSNEKFLPKRRLARIEKTTKKELLKKLKNVQKDA